MDKKQTVTTEYTFDSVWKTLDRLAAEADKRHKETELAHKETERVIRELTEEMKENGRTLTEQMKENERTLAELHKETEKAFKEVAEAHEETEKAIKEAVEERKKTEQVIKNLSENIGGVNNSIGKLVETLIAARLWEKFTGYGLQRAHRRVTVHGDDHRPRAEIDIVLTNTDCAIAVEVKRELDKTEDVDRHLKRMELIRQYPPAVIKENSKRVMGTVAGGTVDPDVMEYAHKRGLFVLELSGESVRLAPAPAGFTPRVW
jgi:predicted RNase H-like nuclease (RuvC/YqgF family)